MARVTIKNIATEMNLSTGTIHRALNGKKGVSEELKEKIKETATKMGYEPNYVASSLKRKTLNIVAAFPVLNEQGRYYYTYIWDGVNKCIDDNKDYNIALVELFYEDDEKSKNDTLLKFLDNFDGEINGLITQGHMGKTGEKAVREFMNRDIPIVFVGDDIDDIDKICCVQTDHNTVGKTVMELLSTQISKESSVLICAGKEFTPSHYITVNGVEKYIKENNLKNKIVKIYNEDTPEKTYKKIIETLNQDKSIEALYSINAKNSVLIAKANEEKNRNLRTIGSDIFAENIDNMKNNSLQNIIFKNPTKQAYIGTKILIDYLVKNEMPKEQTLYVEADVVFQSNLHTYFDNIMT